MKKELVLEPTLRAKNVVEAAKAEMAETVKLEKEKNANEKKGTSKENEIKNTVEEKKVAENKNASEKTSSAKKAASPKKTASTKKETAKNGTKSQVKESMAAQKKSSKAMEKGTGKTEVFVQFYHNEIGTDAVIDRVKKAYISEGNRLSQNDDIRVYIKPEENMIYYVINNSYASGISLY